MSNAPPPQRLSRVGERKLIEHIRRKFYRGHSQIIGIGDDTAVLKAAALSSQGKRDFLWTTDVLVEGVDFDRRVSPFHQVGYKALAANLSDIAAMGGLPRYFLVMLGLSADISFDQVDQLYQGMADLAQDYKVRLLGGDISATPGKVFVGITVLGEAEKGRALLRSGAQAGDAIFVTGTLGDAAAGLDLVKSHTRRHRRLSFLPLLQRQFYPIPRVEEGRLFLTNRVPSAMIDLSDGLASDLRHICEESRVGALVEAGALPLSGALVEYAYEVRKDAVHYALTGGEDFELLFTVPEKRVAGLHRLSLQKGIPITRIGKILARASGIHLRDIRGKRSPFPERGYEHFKPPLP